MRDLRYFYRLSRSRGYTQPGEEFIFTSRWYILRARSADANKSWTCPGRALRSNAILVIIDFAMTYTIEYMSECGARMTPPLTLTRASIKDNRWRGYSPRMIKYVCPWCTKRAEWESNAHWLITVYLVLTWHQRLRKKAISAMLYNGEKWETWDGECHEYCWHNNYSTPFPSNKFV